MQEPENQIDSGIEDMYTSVYKSIYDDATRGLTLEKVNDKLTQLEEKFVTLEQLVDKSPRIDCKENLFFEMTHLKQFQDIMLPQRDDLLTDLEYVESTRVRTVCIHLFRRAAEKLGYTRKNIISELLYRFSQEMLSPEEINDILASDFGLTDFDYET